MPDSSTGEVTSATEEVVAPNSDVNAAADTSTGSDQGKTPGSLVDAVTSALAPKTEGEGSPASQTQDSTKADDPAKAAQAADELPEEVSEDELKDQKPKTRKRIEQLLGKVKGLSTEAETLRPKAQKLDQLVSFIDQNKLTTEDVNVAFDLAALVRNKPEQALERLEPIIQQLRQVVGDILPAELQERVRLGYISEKDARDLHRSQTRAKLADQRAQESQTEAKQQEEAARRQEVIGSVSSAADQWEAAKKSSDPDWHLKSQRIDELVRLKVYENGYPTTKDALVKMLDGIHADVTKEIRKFVPKPQEHKPAVPGGSSSSNVAQPTSLLEAIRSANR